MSQRIEWIDCWKGLAIITVVVGHIVDPVSKYIFWFHMPLFFFISGYLYSKKTDYSAFFKKKFFHLIVPYFSFLFLFTLLQYLPLIIDSWQQKQILPIDKIIISTFPIIWKQLYGGANLVLWFGVFWFVTCLFFTQQLYNLIYIKFGSNNRLMSKIMLCCYCLAMINCYLIKDVVFPWNINVVAMAMKNYPIFANQGIRVIGALIISYIVYKIITNYSILRQLLLGDFSNYKVVETIDKSKV